METNVEQYSTQELEEVFEVKTPVSFDVLYESAKRNLQHLEQNEGSSSNLKEFIINAFIRLCTKHKFQLDESIVKSLTFATQDNILPELHDSSVFDTGSHAIINHTEPETNKNFTPEFTGGVINPLRKQTTKQVISLHTKFRNNYFTTPSNNYQYKLPNPINNVVSMRLLSAEIPNCIYNISASLGNNTFRVIFYDGGDLNPDSEVEVVVDDGKYTGETLSAWLNEYLTIAYIDTRIITRFDKNNCKFYITTDDTHSGTKFDIDFRTKDNETRPIQLNLGWILGFRNPYYSYNSNFNTSKVSTLSGNPYENWDIGYIPESTYNELATNYLLLSVNDYNNNYNQTLQVPFQDGLMKHNAILGKIQNPANSNPMILFNDCDIENNNIRNYFGPVNIDKLQIELLDDMGRYVDINNSDYSFTLSFETLYDL